MADTTAAPSATAPRQPVFSDAYKNVVLSFLVLAYTFNFIDRTIVATIGQAIKVDLKLTDTQLGLLGGLSFAILYTLLGVPIARLAERWNRVSIISAALVVWSGFTVACGFAASFPALLAMRVGVGIGEAGCSPPAHSLISDYYEPKRRASALSIYAFGIPLGAMIGAVAGGWLAKTFGWRVAFMAVGAPGVILALLVKLIVKEPPRGHSDPAERPLRRRRHRPCRGRARRSLAVVRAQGTGRRDQEPLRPLAGAQHGAGRDPRLVRRLWRRPVLRPLFHPRLRPGLRHGRPDLRPDRRGLLGPRHPGRRLRQRLGQQARPALVRADPGDRPRHRRADLHPGLSPDGLAGRRRRSCCCRASSTTPTSARPSG